jgi:hypothetical protein
MKQALVSLFRTVVLARREAAASQAGLTELGAAELRQVTGGMNADSPKNVW